MPGILTADTTETDKAAKSVLKGMDLFQLKSWAVQAGQPPYRGDQLFNWLYAKGAVAPSMMTNLPDTFRHDLEARATLSTAAIVDRTLGRRPNLDTTVKYLVAMGDGLKVETVSMLMDGRHTVCVSSQVGCNLDCRFCATARMGFLRNLSTGEIVDQVLLAQKDRNRRVTNVVFMGMGEPFLNYHRVLAAADIFHHPRAFNLGAGRITISTAGVVPGIQRFTEEQRPYRLAISLNATDDRVRSELMSLNREWPLGTLRDAVVRYSAVSRNRVTFEYVLIAGINDQPANAEQLIHILHKLNCKVNVIPCNTMDGAYHRPDQPTTDAFVNTLRRASFPVTVRWSNGTDIDAGCGQLAAKQTIIKGP
ncbi:23S rRNA (adenine(2503)-C(2))-methyltransferase RlmN [Candidatus Neomarinimicrobiota bacterium]